MKISTVALAAHKAYLAFILVLVTIPSAKPTLFLFRTAMVMIHGQGKLGAKITSCI